MRESSEPADVGTVVHEGLRPLVETGFVDWDLVVALSESYHVPADEVRPLVRSAVKAWGMLEPLFPTPRTETEWSLEGDEFVLTGHTDVDTRDGTVLRILDWKTGRKDTDYRHQMLAYNALGLANTDACEVTSTIVWVRTQEIENYTSRRVDADAWLAQLHREIVDWDGVYHPGDHCRFCNRWYECEAQTAMVRATADQFGHAVPTDLSTMAPGEILSLSRKIKTVMHFARKLQDLIRAHVERSGPVQSDGWELTMTESSRRSVDPIAAWDVLAQTGLTNEDLCKILSVNNKALETVVKGKHGRGDKGTAVQTLWQDLETAGAVSRVTTRKLTEQRTTGDDNGDTTERN